MLAALVILASGLGPSGAPQTEPFLLNDDYQADYQAAKTCSGHPTDVDAVKEGERAIYVVDGQDVKVFLDEYARRFFIDYCAN